jgi:hypothetical protein
VLSTNALIVIVGAVIMIGGLAYSIRIVLMLRKYGLARPWIMLSVMITFFFIGVCIYCGAVFAHGYDAVDTS